MLPCRFTIFTFLRAFVFLSSLRLLDRVHAYVGAAGAELERSTSAAPDRRKGAIDPPPPPILTERVSLASFVALLRELQADCEPDASTTVVCELREELRAVHEQLAATQEEVTAIADE